MFMAVTEAPTIFWFPSSRSCCPVCGVLQAPMALRVPAELPWISVSRTVSTTPSA